MVTGMLYRVCACCKPEKSQNSQQIRRKIRYNRRYIQKSSALELDKVPVLEDIEEAAVDDEELERRLSDDRRPSL